MNLRAQADAIFDSLLWFKTEFGGSFSHFFSRPEKTLSDKVLMQPEVIFNSICRAVWGSGSGGGDFYSSYLPFLSVDHKMKQKTIVQ